MFHGSTRGTDSPHQDAPLSLRESVEAFRLLAACVQDYAIVMLDPEGRVVHWNAGAERLLGYAEEEIRGHHFSCFFTPDDVQRGVPQRELQRARTRGRSENDHWHLRKDGSRFWSSGITYPLWDVTLQGYATVMRDQTERKLAQDALRQSHERHRKLAQELEELIEQRERFLAMLSHELRNPLAPILTALQILQLDPTDDPVQREAQNALARQVWQLVRLVDDLLDTSRLTAGKLRIRKESMELNSVIERAVETSRPLIDLRNHSLSVRLADQPIWMYADPSRLEQVFLNLLTNAAKYTEQGGQIRLSVECHDHSAVVTVADTGIGIPAEMLENIFEMFTQVDRAQERAAGGLGIGLTLVKRLVGMHDGSVQVHSDGPERGAVFTVRLPIVADPNQPQRSISP